MMQFFIAAAVTLMTTACVNLVVNQQQSQPVPQAEVSYSRSARSGPWASDLARLQSHYDKPDWEALERDLDQTTPRLRDQYGENSPAYAEALMLRALMLFETERQTEALPIFAESAERYAAALGEPNRDVALALNSYADALMVSTEDEAAAEAMPYYQRAYDNYLGSLGPAAHETKNTTRWLARALMLHGRATSDRAALERAEALMAASLPRYGTDEPPFEHVLALALHGNILAALNRNAEAEAQFTAALDASTRLSDGDYLSVSNQIYTPFVAFLEPQGRTAEAQALRAKQEERNRSATVGLPINP